MNLKKMSNDDLYEYLYQSDVDECDIPRTRKNRIAMAREVGTQFRTPAVRA